MTAFWPGTPPTRQLSWTQLVRDSDPNFTRLSLQPWCYEFSNGRLFVDTLPTYTPFDISEGLILVRGGPVILLRGGDLELVED